jgi:hypothetical protein
MTEAKVKPPADYSFAQPYVRPRASRPALIVDIDGTLLTRTERGIHDYLRVSEDVPNDNVVRIVKLIWAGLRCTCREITPQLIFLSGRPDSCMEATEVSIKQLNFLNYMLLMRDTGDYRPDYIVKYELFDRYIRHDYDVAGAIDDRLQVVGLWRHLGILCLDVAGGTF